MNIPLKSFYAGFRVKSSFIIVIISALKDGKYDLRPYECAAFLEK